ncbi:hypothetical protein QFC24_004007 [Naganishia onofrii]|uniref:Uncharacterized protein n=1 Tax=Naganishia onofrii TaxID=1851511 RepID=A0ACC2XHV8_9TREE|nr:hypothetical protein QFC24_004007 [Naganishia onofrii]
MTNITQLPQQQQQIPQQPGPSALPTTQTTVPTTNTPTPAGNPPPSAAAAAAPRTALINVDVDLDPWETAFTHDFAGLSDDAVFRAITRPPRLVSIPGLGPGPGAEGADAAAAVGDDDGDGDSEAWWGIPKAVEGKCSASLTVRAFSAPPRYPSSPCAAFGFFPFVRRLTAVQAVPRLVPL